MVRGIFIRNLLSLLIVVLLGVGGYFRWQTVKNPILQGETMGTTYSITIADRVYRGELEELPNLINDQLAELNRQMSTWDPTSEISAFNASGETGPFEIAPEFSGVLKKALTLSRITEGAFDPTLNPLLNVWGFGSLATEQRIPSDSEIEAVRATTGWDKLWFDENNHLWKSNPQLELNLGAIAKGYGVDVIADLLQKLGYENWFVEIGGEVLVRGNNPKGQPWRVGIQYPTTNPMDGRLQGIVSITDDAVATSGDYRNFIEKDGVVYSHILDPRSGRTVLSDTAGVTVIARNCMTADGIATALFVMGPIDGLAWVNDRTGVEAMFLVRGKDGEISEYLSSGFKKRTGYIPSN